MVIIKNELNLKPMYLEIHRFFYYLYNSATLSKSFIIDIFFWFLAGWFPHNLVLNRFLIGAVLLFYKL